MRKQLSEEFYKKICNDFVNFTNSTTDLAHMILEKDGLIHFLHLKDEVKQDPNWKENINMDNYEKYLKDNSEYSHIVKKYYDDLWGFELEQWLVEGFILCKESEKDSYLYKDGKWNFCISKEDLDKLDLYRLIIKESIIFSKSGKYTPEKIVEELSKVMDIGESPRKKGLNSSNSPLIWKSCKTRLKDDYEDLKKGTIGVVLAYDVPKSYIKEAINKLPEDMIDDIRISNYPRFITPKTERCFEDSELETNYKKELEKDYDLKKNMNIDKIESEENKIMKIRAEVREIKSEKDSKLRGFANLTIGDVVIKDVVVKEFESKFNEGAIYYGFQMPTSRSYEKEDGTKVYIPAVELKSTNEEDTKKLVKEVRDLITQALDVSETNEYGKKVCEGEIEFDYDKDKIRTYVEPKISDKNPNLRAFATAYIGNIVKINDIAMSEIQNKETGDKFNIITFPSKTREIEGETKFEEKVFTIGEGMKKSLVKSIEENLKKELEQQIQEEPDEEENLEP